MYVNYKLFFAFMEKAPKDNDLVYPIKIDIIVQPLIINLCSY